MTALNTIALLPRLRMIQESWDDATDEERVELLAQLMVAYHYHRVGLTVPSDNDLESIEL